MAEAAATMRPTDHTPRRSRRDFLRFSALGLLSLLAPRWTGASPVRAMTPAETLDRIASQLTVIRRLNWTRTAPHLERMTPAASYSRITVHHAGTQPFRRTSRSRTAGEISRILESHLDQRYGDIAYHLIVDYSGRVWEGRSLAYEGAHVSSENEGNIGVMLLGNFERQYPSASQLATLDELVGLLRRQYHVPAMSVYAHRDLSPTLCPGERLYPSVAEMRLAG